MHHSRAVVGLLVTGAIAAVIALVPSAASADTPGCVSQREYYQAARGMRPSQISGLFDTKGTSVFDHLYTEEINDGYWATDDFTGKDVWVDSTRLVNHHYVVRSYRKCSGFDGGRGVVGVRFFDYGQGGALHLTLKARQHPRDLIPY